MTRTSEGRRDRAPLRWRRDGARWAAAALVTFALSAGAETALAQPKPAPAATAKPAAAARPAAAGEVQGTVLQLDKDDLVLDIGSTAGATQDLVLDLWRPFRIKHPVSGKVLTDRFKIGQIQVGQVRPSMSLAKPVGTLSRAAETGDLVFFTPVSAAAPQPAAAKAAPAAVLPSEKPDATPYDEPSEAAPADQDAKNVMEMFEALKNQNIPARITRYEAFLRAHPDSRFFTVLFEENIALKRLLAPTPAGSSASERRPPGLVHAPEKVDGVPGRPIRIAVELTDTADGAVLQMRHQGETLYVPLAMARVGKGYFAATIPADRVEDRDIEYFIEAVGPGGAAVTVFGSPHAPERIDVQSDPRVTPPQTGKGSVSVLTDYADYNRLVGNDYVWQTEGTFGVRYKDLGIRAVRMGFGVYRGVSGTVAELDVEGKKGRSVGLTYGYVEAEFGIHRYFSLISRLAVGLLDDGIGGGGQLLARIGNDEKTNLLVGGELIGGVGLRSIIELQLNTFERFPIVLRTEVTNQPAGSAPTPSQIGPGIAIGTSDVAGRGIAQIGYRITPELTLSVRGSFQGRNINHAGPGFGGSVGYTW